MGKGKSTVQVLLASVLALILCFYGLWYIFINAHQDEAHRTRMAFYVLEKAKEITDTPTWMYKGTLLNLASFEAGNKGFDYPADQLLDDTKGQWKEISRAAGYIGPKTDLSKPRFVRFKFTLRDDAYERAEHYILNAEDAEPKYTELLKAEYIR